MVKVTVTNTTTINVKIQEGNAGVYSTRATLRPNEKFQLDLDQNATYRDYVLIRLPDNMPLEPMFSSDDVVELEEIIIRREVDGPNYCWEKIFRGQIPNNGRHQRNNGEVEMHNPPGCHISLVQRLKNYFK